MDQTMRCVCGCRVREDDLLAVDERLDLTEGVVRLRFVCSRCERVASISLDPEEWDGGRLLSPGGEAPDGDRDECSGPRLITYAEVREFELSLDSTDQPLAGLLAVLDAGPDRARANQEHAD